jgi:cytochrome b
MDNKQTTVRVWDLPTRLFHWGLVIGVALAWLTGDVLEQMTPHQIIGLTVLGLVVFRLVWGVMGSTYARFSQFIVGLAAVKRYLTGRWHGLGHNPLGGWSVVAMLLLLAGMVVTGLFANNDADYTGPLAFLVNTELSGWLTHVHHFLFKVLWVVIAIHIGAIVIYKRFLGKDLIRPMIVGDAPRENETDKSAQGGGWLAFVVAVAIALAAVYGASGVWHQPPAKKPAAEQSADW